MIRKCSKCSDYRAAAAAYQNKKYGVGMRVHNPTGGGWRCTVCGTTKSK